MTKYDDLFETTTPRESVFADKRALDPLSEPEKIVAREAQECELATTLNGVHEGYLPTTVSIYGPPGTGKTLTTRRLCREFADRREDVAVEYVNLKECRTLFSVANEILYELTGEKNGAYEGIDGAFESIWSTLEDYPEWTILLLDEIDHIQHDTNYDPSDFFYRLLRGEGRLQRDIDLSVFLISNELLDVDLRLDSRVQSAVSGEEVFFPPYGIETLRAVLAPRLKRAFRDGALPEAVRELGTRQAARRWGDARKALTLFRQAGETANERGLETVTEDCLAANLEATEQAALEEKLLSLPFNHFFVLTVVAGVRDADDTDVQPVTTAQIADRVDDDALAAEVSLGERAIREVLTDLETMGLVETWIDSRGRDGRVKQVETTFDPQWIRDAIVPYLETTDQISPDELLASPPSE
jgi:archaeal cell division control protein 6